MSLASSCGMDAAFHASGELVGGVDGGMQC